MEPRVFQNKNVALGQLRDCLGRDRPDAIVGKADRLRQDHAQRVRNGPQRHRRHALPLRTLEMAAHDHLGARIHQLVDGRHQALEPGCVGDGAVMHRHVQVGAQQHALPLQIDPIERPNRHYRLPNSAAVSIMRFEKPHSLSYHPITRASWPSTTAVCVASNEHDAGLWLKSMLTSFSVL